MQDISSKIAAFVEKEFHSSALPALKTFIEIPNTSKEFDPEWNTNGLLEKAASHLKSWVEAQNLAKAKVEIHQEPGLSPLIFIEIEGQENSETVLMYGHFDKQPHNTGWREGLGPTKPVIEGEKLYGRGAADDGYSIFASVLAVKACQANGLPHSRICIMIEGDEESGSTHLPTYFEKLSPRIGNPDLIMCLDSGCQNYDQLWVTSSLRGNLTTKLTVKILKEGVHSGEASGIVPDTFRIIRQILARIENPETGEICKDFTVPIPEHRVEEAREVSKTLGEPWKNSFPWASGAKPVSQQLLTLYLNQTWLPQLTVIGQEGLPSISVGGNVLRPETSIKMSLRLPPTLDADVAFERMKKICEHNPPYDAQVSLTNLGGGQGWNAPKYEKELENSLKEASNFFFKREMMQYGQGASIPFMSMLSKRYPKTQFCIVGVLGPGSNAHGPNEFLHLGYTKKLTSSVAYVLAKCFKKLARK